MIRQCCRVGPPFRLKLGRARQGKAVTIAAGFRFNGGVFLCADSQLTYGGVAKTAGQKLITVKMHPWPMKIGFAIAGDVHKAKTAIRNIACAIQALPQSASGEQIFRAIEDAQRACYHTVFSHPLYTRGQGPDYYLLICLWTPSQGSGLLITNEDNVTEVRDYDCRGTGDYLFRYIIHDVYRDDMDLQEMVALTTHAMEEIKGYDPNVGFNSEFLVFFMIRRCFRASLATTWGTWKTLAHLQSGSFLDICLPWPTCDGPKKM